MKFSVVTVCFNHARFIEDCIRSVLDQNYPHLEFIIIDGGSTDGSREIIAKYADQLAFWVSEPDGGQTAALVKGFSHATGDIFCWINSDDQLEPGSLHEVAEFFTNNPNARIVTGDHIKMREDGTPIKVQREIPFNAFIWNYTYNYTAQTSTFWRKDLYHEVGGLNPNFNVGMDSDLFSRFSLVAKWYTTRRIWSRFRLHSAQKTQNLHTQMRAEDLAIMARYAGRKQSALEIQLLRVFARVLRVVWRLATNCYFYPLPPDKKSPLYPVNSTPAPK